MLRCSLRPTGCRPSATGWSLPTTRRRTWKAEGAHSEKRWLAQRCRLTPGEAAGRARIAHNLDLLPETAEAAVAGEIGTGQARVAAKAVRDLPRETLDGLDRLVLDQGPGGDAWRLRTTLDEFAHRAATARYS